MASFFPCGAIPICYGHPCASFTHPVPPQYHGGYRPRGACMEGIPPNTNHMVPPDGKYHLSCAFSGATPQPQTCAPTLVITDCLSMGTMVFLMAPFLFAMHLGGSARRGALSAWAVPLTAGMCRRTLFRKCGLPLRAAAGDAASRSRFSRAMLPLDGKT
jgi:hypothetical protein